MITIRLADSREMDAVAAFYTHCGYGDGVQPEDRVFTAHEDALLVGTDIWKILTVRSVLHERRRKRLRRRWQPV